MNRIKDRGWFTESEVRRAAYSCTSNAQAARLMSISGETWKKYASLYLEPTTKVTYYEYLIQKRKQKNPALTDKQRIFSVKKLSDILEGHVTYKNTEKLFERLLKENVKLPECEMCGYAQPNPATGEIPILLNFVDGNTDNTKLNNLEILCYNCAATTTNLKFKWTNSTTNSD